MAGGKLGLAYILKMSLLFAQEQVPLHCQYDLPTIAFLVVEWRYSMEAFGERFVVGTGTSTTQMCYAVSWDTLKWILVSS
jgi:hypothetical protein